MNWIEFKAKHNGNKISLRSSWIGQITEVPFNAEDNTGEYTIVEYECGNSISSRELAEPYDQVKQKIMDAEKAGPSDAAVEHLTRDDYEALLPLVQCEKIQCEQDNIPARAKFMSCLIDKLKEILKEDNE